MSREWRLRLAILAVAGLLLGLPLWSAAEKEDEEDKGRVRLEVHLTAEETGKPISGASVYVKFREERFLRRDKKRQWSVKTNEKGKAIFPVPLPEGRVLVQVVAEGWKTYGRYHRLKGPKHILEIKLKEPRKWY
ncbi:carboxypeptidase-like regulatory domain-containing protein [Acidobacteriia bacterium AH_259_A11_L15]|nr:carboxypeptidase-like regulatory domain-containing protein [Acidobacteriia bacterium AH_259_A11_L15]